MRLQTKFERRTWLQGVGGGEGRRNNAVKEAVGKFWSLLDPNHHICSATEKYLDWL